MAAPWAAAAERVVIVDRAVVVCDGTAPAPSSVITPRMQRGGVQEEVRAKKIYTTRPQRARRTRAHNNARDEQSKQNTNSVQTRKRTNVRGDETQ